MFKLTKKKKCIHCGKKIREQDDVCKHCGKSQVIPKQKPMVYAISIAVFFLVLMLGSILFPDESEPVSANIPAVTTSSRITESTSKSVKETTSETTTTITTKLETVSSTTKSSVTSSTAKNIGATIHFLDTGNSDSILIRQGDKSVLIDGAESNDSTSIINYLKKAGVKKIDYMINTHPDADHVGGLAEIMKEFEIGTLFVSNGYADTKTYHTFIETAGNLNLSPQVPLKDSQFKISDNSYLQFYNVEAVGKNNEVSLITLFVNGTDKFLFTGDAEVAQEKNYLSELPDVDVLKVGHHGSNTSTSDAFLKKIKPEFAVITVGADNKYGHPHQDVLARLNKQNVAIYRTDLHGNIVFASSGKRVTVSLTTTKNLITTKPQVTTAAKTTTTTTSTTTTPTPITSTFNTTTTSASQSTTTSISTTKSNLLIIVTPSGKEIPSNYKFKNCDEVRQYFPNGFTKHDYPNLYEFNLARDGDKDGYACE